MTAEELLALPDDEIERELIRGELREYPMTTRGTPHCLATHNLDFLLGTWLRQQPRPRGRVYAGDIRVRVRRNPDTFVGVDLVYISAELAAQTAKNTKFIETIAGLPGQISEQIVHGVRITW